MGKIAIMLIVVQLISKIFGFSRDIILAYFYGASDISDAYLISITIPTVIFTFIGIGLSTSFIPVFNEICQKEDINKAEIFTSNLINLMMVICSVIVLICIVFTTPIIKAFASGFSKELIKITVNFTRLSIWGIYFATLIFIGTSYLQMKNKYLIPPLTGIVFNGLIIVSICLGAKFNPILLALGSVLAIATQSFIIIGAMKRNGFRYFFILKYKDPYIKHLVTLILPVILGISATQINVLIDRTISSRIIVGGISTLIYANRLCVFIEILFVTTVTTIMYPKITKLASEKRMDLHSKIFKKSLIYVTIILMPITFGAMIFSDSIIKILYGRGAFSNESLVLTSKVLFYYSIGMIGTGFREILLKVFYSLEDTKNSTKNFTISTGLNIVLNLILSKYMGIAGLALATSISSIFCAVLLFISLRKKIGPLGLKKFSFTFGKILTASSFTGIIAKLLFDHLLMIISPTTSFVIVIVIGAMNYFILIYFMKINEVYETVSTIKIISKEILHLK